MRFLQIDGQSIQISLGAPDMKELGISFDEMDYENTATRRAVWQVLDRARDKTGFDAAKGRIEIRAVASRGGGCELFVKRTLGDFGGDGVAYTKENIRTSIEKSEREECVCYRFDSLKDLACACRHVAAREFEGKSAAYFDDCGSGYYLVLRDAERKPALPRFVRSLSFLSEFGTLCSAPCADSYIAEHCKCICERDAVKIISENC